MAAAGVHGAARAASRTSGIRLLLPARRYVWRPDKHTFRVYAREQKAALLADRVLTELVKELKVRQVRVVFASFSGGPKGCTYKVFQLIEGRCQGQLTLDDYQLVRDCVCGQMYDSSPVDFVSDLGTHFLLHPSVLKMPQPPRVLSWMTKGMPRV